VFRFIIVLFHVTEVTGKVLFDRNILHSPIVNRIHSYCYCSSVIVIIHRVYDDCWMLYCTVTVTVSSQYSK